MKDADMSNQTAVDAVQASLQTIETEAQKIQGVLDANRDPFEDRDCNRALRRLARRWGRISGAIKDWHEDAETCVSTGDPTVNFGGGGK